MWKPQLAQGSSVFPLSLSWGHESMNFLYWAADELDSNSNTAATCLLIGLFPLMLTNCSNEPPSKNIQGLLEAVIIPLW